MAETYRIGLTEIHRKAIFQPGESGTEIFESTVFEVGDVNRRLSPPAVDAIIAHPTTLFIGF